jgi:sortase A
VLGEVLITIGVVVLLYVSWQMWIGDWIIGAQANSEGKELSQQWQSEDPVVSPSPSASSTTSPPEPPPSGILPIALPQPKNGQDFGVVHIPRFGADYSVTVAGGVTKARTLDKHKIGHYPDTAMPGQQGNFALAGHRTTYGAPFGRIADLRLGDAIVVETKDGWYTYRFRTLEYVTPQTVNVLDAVPQVGNVADGERYITLTSCSPKYSNSERIIAYGVFDSFQPRADGPPASLPGGA